MKKTNKNIKAVKLWNELCPKYFPLMAANALFSNMVPYFNLYMSALIVNEISAAANITAIGMLVAGTIAGNFCLTVIGGILDREFNHEAVLLDQREKILFNNKVLTLDYEKLENTEVRQLRRKIKESSKIDSHGKQSLINNLNSFTNSFIDILFAMAFFTEMIVQIMKVEFGWLMLLLLGIIIFFIILNIWINFYTNKKISKLSNCVSQAMIDENRIDDALDCYNMGKDIRLYRQDGIIMKIKEYAFQLHKNAFKKLFTEKFKNEIPKSALSYLLQIISYIFICIYTLKGIFGIGSIIKYIGFMQRLINSIVRLFDISSNIKYNTPFIEDYLNFLDIENKWSQGERLVEEKEKAEIEFHNVSFCYPGADTYALKNLDIKIQAGRRVAVVGINGSGKTTMIKLLCRLYDPTEGMITLNGINIKEYDYNQYLSIFAVVFQDFKLFSFGLGQNIAASTEYDADKAKDALKKAGFLDRLSSMQRELDTALYKDFEEDGVEISGGEAQKIAMARAIYKDAPFVILDEPTAALDPIAEFDIYSGFDKIVGNKTAVYISHRLASCRFCDDIIVLHEGKLIQQGSHASLLRNKEGKYYELWNSQAKYYTE